MKLLILIIFLFPAVTAFGQKNSDSSGVSKNTVFVEFLGNCGVASVNYDSINFNTKYEKLTVRIGLLPPTKKIDLTSATLEVNYLRGKKSHHFQASLGLSYFNNIESN